MKHNGYIFHHTTNHYLEIFIHDNLSHIIHEIEKTAENKGFKVSKKQTEKYGLVRLKIIYKQGENIREIYPTINKNDVVNIRNYESIEILKDLLKNAFR